MVFGLRGAERLARACVCVCVCARVCWGAELRVAATLGVFCLGLRVWVFSSEGPARRYMCL